MHDPAHLAALFHWLLEYALLTFTPKKIFSHLGRKWHGARMGVRLDYYLPSQSLFHNRGPKLAGKKHRAGDA
jgi:hypothetical protein